MTKRGISVEDALRMIRKMRGETVQLEVMYEDGTIGTLVLYGKVMS